MALRCTGPTNAECFVESFDGRLRKVTRRAHVSNLNEARRNYRGMEDRDYNTDRLHTGALKGT